MLLSYKISVLTGRITSDPLGINRKCHECTPHKTKTSNIEYV